jgi:hypothetical protein
MRGSPLLRALLVFLGLAALGPVLWRLTQPEPVQAVIPTAPTTENQPRELRLTLAFSTPPKRIALTYLGKPLWSKDAPAAEEKCTLQVVWPAEGGELGVSIDWPEGAPLAAARFRLTPPGGEEIERNLWGAGPTEETIGFP